MKMEECGTGYEPGDASDLSRIITELYDEPGRRKTWSENAKRVFERHFDAEIVYKDMARYLGNIANGFRERYGRTRGDPSSCLRGSSMLWGPRSASF